MRDKRDIKIISTKIGNREYNSSNDYAENTPLLEAILNNDTWFVLQFCLELKRNKADKDLSRQLNRKDKIDTGGNTPLLLALKKGNKMMANALIMAGADVKCRDAHGYTPMHYACFYRFDNIIKNMIDKGADINPKPPKPDPCAIIFDYTPKAALTPFEFYKQNFTENDYELRYGRTTLAPDQAGGILTKNEALQDLPWHLHSAIITQIPKEEIPKYKDAFTIYLKERIKLNLDDATFESNYGELFKKIKNLADGNLKEAPGPIVEDNRTCGYLYNACISLFMEYRNDKTISPEIVELLSIDSNDNNLNQPFFP